MKRVSLISICMIMVGNLFAQSGRLGIFDNETDVGNPVKKGSTSYEKDKQEYIIEGSGTNMWDKRDEFHFVWKKLKGNFILRTRASLLGTGVDPHRKFGWMV